MVERVSITYDFRHLLEEIASNNEQILADKTDELLTNKHRYFRGKCGWEMDEEPGKPVERYGRAGRFFVWQKEIEEVKTEENKNVAGT